MFCAGRVEHGTSIRTYKSNKTEGIARRRNTKKKNPIYIPAFIGERRFGYQYLHGGLQNTQYNAN